MLYLSSPALLLTGLLVSFNFSTALSQTPAAPTTQPPATALQDKRSQVDQLLKECGDLIRKGRFAELTTRGNEAFALSQALGDNDRMAQSIGYVGSADFYLGRLQEALDHHQQAATLALAAGNKRFYGASLQNLGATLSAMGRYEEALFYLNKTLEIGKELNAGIGVWFPMRNIGDLYIHLGDFDKAETILLAALSLARQFKNRLLEEATLTTLISVPAGRKQYQAALEYAHQAAAIDVELKHPGARYELLTDTGVIYQEIGDYQKAIELYQQAMELARSSGTTLAEAVITSNIGYCQNAMGHPSEALATQLKAREVIDKMGEYAYPVEESLIDWRIGLVKEAMGQDEEALKVFNDSLNKIERVRVGAVRSESSRASIGASSWRLFFDTIEILLKLNRPSDAFAVAERYRARAFLDLLAEQRIDLRQELTVAQRKQEDTLSEHLSAIQKELLKEGVTPERRLQLGNDLTAAESDLEAFQLELRHENPRYASVQHADLLSTERVQKELLSPDSVLIEFMLGDKRSYAWIISPKSVNVAVLPPRKDIEDQVVEYRQLLTSKVSELTVKRDLTNYQSASRKLYQSVIAPFEKWMSGSRKLLIAPDGVLAYLPFETLSMVDKAAARNREPEAQRTVPLVERFEISYIPSASALAAINNRKQQPAAPRKAFVAFGDPAYNSDNLNTKAAGAAGEKSEQRSQTFSTKTLYTEGGFEFTQLPSTRYEVVAIGNLFPRDQSKLYLGLDASEEAVKAAQLDQYRYLHFATHALIDDRLPGRSGVVLSLSDNSKEDGILQMGEIMRLKLHADLVTLSACSTGLGKVFEGEGVVGLTRAFLYAGADSVVVSLWNVNDNATAELMKSFYTNLNRGLSKEGSLRQAKLKMLHGRQLEWTHPYFWAPFVVEGKP